jgi:hypothetical protein
VQAAGASEKSKGNAEDGPKEPVKQKTEYMDTNSAIVHRN